MPRLSPLDIGATFVNHVLANLDPRRLFLTGDPTFAITCRSWAASWSGRPSLRSSARRMAQVHWRDGSSRYVVYGLVVSLVPASLTSTTSRRCGSSPFRSSGSSWWGSARARCWTAPPASGGAGRAARRDRRPGGAFQFGFWREGPAWLRLRWPFPRSSMRRWRPALCRSTCGMRGTFRATSRPTYGALRGMDRTAFVRLPTDQLPPAGAIVLGTDNVGACEVLVQDGDYIAYRAGASPRPDSSRTATSRPSAPPLNTLGRRSPVGPPRPTPRWHARCAGRTQRNWRANRIV